METPAFINETPLSLSSASYPRELRALDRESFPVIEDFSVRVEPTDVLGDHLRFVSASLGDLAGFPWWDHVEREIARMTPLDRVGTPERPYDDLDQGWQIVIWRDAGFVYVLEHNEPCTTVFRTWFRVPLHVWMDAWRQAIRGG